MRKKLYLLFFSILSIFLIVSCSKYSKMLDIDLYNIDIEGNVNLGIPLINADYSIEKILKEFGYMDFINYESNGDYYFEYETPKDKYFDICDYNKIDISQDFLLHFVVDPTLTQVFVENNIRLFTEDIAIDEGTFKSGQIVFDFSSVTPPTKIDYDILISSAQLTSVTDGATFSMKLSKNNPIGYDDCIKYRVKTDTRYQVCFTVKITLKGDPLVGSLDFKPRISFKNAVLKDADIEVLRELQNRFNAATEFTVFKKKINLRVTLHNPKLLLDITNKFGSRANLLISKAYLKSKTQTVSILLNDNAQIPIPENQNGVIDITSSCIKKDIYLSSDYDSVHYECTVLIPPGKVKIHDNSTVAAGIKFVVPFDITIDEAVLNDTVAFGLPGLSSLSFLDTVTMRTEFASSIPADFKMQILFYNSTTQKAVDSLMTQPLIIKGSYDGSSAPSTARYIHITENRLKTLQETDKLIIQLSLGSDGKHRNFNQKNGLHVKMGARIISAIPK